MRIPMMMWIQIVHDSKITSCSFIRLHYTTDTVFFRGCCRHITDIRPRSYSIVEDKK